MTQDHGTYVLRLSRCSDFQKITDFCEEHRHHNVRRRDPAVLQERAQAGSVVLLEDASGNIKGMMASYPLISTGADGVPSQSWTEIGSARIVLNGYPGLFDTMMALNIMRAHLLEPPEQGMIGRVGNTAVQKRIQGMGWEEFTPGADVVALAGRTKLQDRDIAAPSVEECDPKWYRVNPEKLSLIAQTLVDAIDQPVMTRRDGTAQMTIDFGASGFIRAFEAPIRALAATAGRPKPQGPLAGPAL